MMNYIVTNIFACLGVIVAVGIVVTLIMAVFIGAVDSVKNLYVHICYGAESRGRRDMGARLVQESYWYSEDEAVMAAFEIVGRKIMSHTDGYCNISDCREEWRNRKGKSK